MNQTNLAPSRPRFVASTGLLVLLAFTACGQNESGPSGSDPSVSPPNQKSSPGVPVPNGGTVAVTDAGRTEAKPVAANVDGGTLNVGGASGPGNEMSGGGGGSVGSGGGGNGGGTAGVGPEVLDRFSFFVTSHRAMTELSGNQDGFGGDFRYGEADGLSGADKICTEIADSSMPGSGAKQWRAFLSTSQVNAIDRVGQGPWYDRLGRLVSEDVEGLKNPRPLGAERSIINDLPNEDGVPNQRPDGMFVDNHHILTGSDATGERLPGANCNDWTSAAANAGNPSVGLSWLGPGTRKNWIHEGSESGCLPGGTLMQWAEGPVNTVGSGGGYGGIYCFALNP